MKTLTYPLFPLFALVFSLLLTVPPSLTTVSGALQSDKGIRIKLYEYGFKVSDPIVESNLQFYFKNDGVKTHEVVLIRLNPGVTGKAFIEAGETGSSTRGLGSPIRNIPPLKTGDQWSLFLKLRPGNYMMTCFVADEQTGKSHLMLGMIHEFSVL